ncbi:MAG: hypothetical protein ACTSXW_08860 [Candidatus Baldrarchaeia archaeon]
MSDRQVFLSLREFAKEEFEAKRAKKVEVLRIKKKGAIRYKLGPVEYIVISYFRDSVRIYYFLRGGFLAGADTVSIEDFKQFSKILEGKTKLLIKFEEKVEKPPTLPELSARLHKEFLKILERLKYLCNRRPRDVPVVVLRKELGEFLVREGERVLLDASLLEKPYEAFLVYEAFYRILPEFLKEREYWSRILTAILVPGQCESFPEYFPKVSASFRVREEKIRSIFMFLNFLEKFEKHLSVKESKMLLDHVLAKDVGQNLYFEASKLYQEIYLDSKDVFWAFKAALFNLAVWDLKEALEITRKYLNDPNNPKAKVFSKYIDSSANLAIKTSTELLLKIKQDFNTNSKFLRLLFESFETVKKHVLRVEIEPGGEYSIGEETSIRVILENCAKDVLLKKVKVNFENTVPKNSIKLLEDWSQGYCLLEEIRPANRETLLIPLKFLRDGKIKIRIKVHASDSLNNRYKAAVARRIIVKGKRDM